ncbi:PAS domain S-box protein [Ochrobactrum sp. Kaboul]|nr:PAS domain S-box protein [Ochrobactrum sp. Kaboul]
MITGWQRLLQHNGKLAGWNKASSALFGFATEEALGESLDIFIPLHLRNAHWTGFDAAVKAGQLKLNGKPTLTRATHKSGQKLYVELSFALVQSDEQVVGSVVVIRDVTEKIEREKASR